MKKGEKMSKVNILNSDKLQSKIDKTDMCGLVNHDRLHQLTLSSSWEDDGMSMFIDFYEIVTKAGKNNIYLFDVNESEWERYVIVYAIFTAYIPLKYQPLLLILVLAFVWPPILALLFIGLMLL